MINLSRNNGTAASLNQKSQKILGIFTRTVQQLQEVNAIANEEIAVKEAEIKAAQQEKEELEALKIDNDKIIHNIKNILQN